jgi:hypothetical protein
MVLINKRILFKLWNYRGFFDNFFFVKITLHKNYVVYTWNDFRKLNELNDFGRAWFFSIRLFWSWRLTVTFFSSMFIIERQKFHVSFRLLIRSTMEYTFYKHIFFCIVRTENRIVERCFWSTVSGLPPSKSPDLVNLRMQSLIIIVDDIIYLKFLVNLIKRRHFYEVQNIALEC